MKKSSCPREASGGKPTCNDSPCEKYLSKKFEEIKFPDPKQEELKILRGK